MDYYTREQIPILAFDEDPESIARELIRQALCEKPCNIVFIEVRGKLSGVASYGDILRAGKGAIPVNRNFTFLKGKQFVKAREIFREKPNINEIPVVDAESRLLGMCSRNDDLLYLEYANPWEGNRYLKPLLDRVKTVCVVRPPEGDVRRRRIVDRWTEEFEKRGVPCESIDFEAVPRLQHEKTAILLADEETKQGAAATFIALDEDVCLADVVYTFREFERLSFEHGYDELVRNLADSGIKIYNMYYTVDESTEGRRRLWNGMRDWKKQLESKDSLKARYNRPYVFPDCARDFYGELYTESYAAEVGRFSFRIETNNVYSRLKDVKSRYLNVVNGERVTIGQPTEADRTIWFFGPCLIIGNYVEDRHTVESFLQERLNREGYSCKVVNCGCYEESPYQEIIHITSTPMKPGDVVVFNLDNRIFDAAESIDLTEILDQNDVPTGWLLEHPMHCNHKVNKIYADELFDRMVRDGALTERVDKNENRTMLSSELAVKTLYLDVHFDGFQASPNETTGAVGMHANPFTLGHRYLVETASKQVDRLIVLLIEDEFGEFSYAERLAMAVEGTRDLPNVKIFPAGPFQASRNMFRAYFIQIEPSSMRESSLADVLIFAKPIAKRLNITRRFVGDERHNPKMQFYNDLAKEIMPQYGIEVVEIPRAQVKGRAISASLTRSAAVEGDRETLLENVPETTLKFLIGEE